MTLKLFPYQKEGVDLIHKLNNGRVLLADDMGLGKSVQSYMYKQKYLGANATTIIICPAYLKWNWADEIQLHFGIKARILSGRKLTKKLKSGHTYIINYEILANYIQEFKSINPELLIIDECQKIKNREIKSRAHVKKISKYCKHVVALSGTPIENNAAEFWSVLNIIAPNEFNNFYRYAMRYSKATRGRWGWKFPGVTRSKELHRRLKRFMIRRTKKEVLKDLPDKQRILLPLKISKINEYKEAVTNFQKWMIRNHGREKARAALIVEALAQIGYLKRLAAQLKHEAVIQWIDDYLQSGKKLIVFGIHRSVMEPLVKHYKNICTIVNGSVTGQERQRRFKAFNTNPNVKILFANMKAAGTGWSCNSTSTAAFIEFEWVPGLHTQAEDRIHGLNRGLAGETSTYYYLFAKNTIEEKLIKTLQRKDFDVSKILDGKVSSNALALYNILVKDMLNESIPNKRLVT
jgi:SWI/SNF-related matrix-associated actin-dependent regulator 1 of chromatin subfamily A